MARNVRHSSTSTQAPQALCLRNFTLGCSRIAGGVRTFWAQTWELFVGEVARSSALLTPGFEPHEGRYTTRRGGEPAASTHGAAHAPSPQLLTSRRCPPFSATVTSGTGLYARTVRSVSDRSQSRRRFQGVQSLCNGVSSWLCRSVCTGRRIRSHVTDPRQKKLAPALSQEYDASYQTGHVGR